jgi:hypothetical protein
MRLFTILFLTLLIPTFLFSADNKRKRRPLDLPSGGPGGDEDEDSPEIIHFYGNEHEGDTFFWCLDISGSMAMGNPSRIGILKQEVANAIDQLSTRARFSIVCYNNWIYVWKPAAVKADTQNKQDAKVWMFFRNAYGPTYCLKGMQEVFKVRRKTRPRPRHPLVILVGDGLPYPEDPSDTYTGIKAANKPKGRVDTILVGDGEGSRMGWTPKQFMELVATSNRGTSRHVED